MLLKCVRLAAPSAPRRRGSGFCSLTRSPGMGPGEPGLLGVVPAASSALNSERGRLAPRCSVPASDSPLDCAVMGRKGLTTHGAFGEFARQRFDHGFPVHGAVLVGGV